MKEFDDKPGVYGGLKFWRYISKVDTRRSWYGDNVGIRQAGTE